MGYTPEKFRKRSNKTYVPLSAKEIEKIAFWLLRYLIENGLSFETRIYYRTKHSWNAICDEEPHYTKNLEYEKITRKIGRKEYEIYIVYGINPNDYFEHNGETISASFEGPLYHALNRTSWKYSGIAEKIQNYFSHWGLHYELEDAWNFSAYET